MDTLPEWCRRPLTAFLDLKKREGKAPATVDMYRSSCTRFCLFLTEEGISSFHELTADLIKAFNLWDRHKTIEGKNAYNVRIRKFLLYLSEK
jgi:site-specific recombinase XerD